MIQHFINAANAADTYLDNLRDGIDEIPPYEPSTQEM